MAEKFTFKKEPQTTGLAGVGNPYPNTAIKHKKKEVGVIYAPTWQTKDDKWSISLMVLKKEDEEQGNCEWNWISLKARFDSEPEAREFLKEHVEGVLAKGLHHAEDD